MKLLKIFFIITICSLHNLQPSNPTAKDDTAKGTPKKITIPPAAPAAKTTAHQTAAPKISKTPTAPAKHTAPAAPLIQATKAAPAPSTPAKTVAQPTGTVPYLQELKTAGMTQPILTAWSALYEQCTTAQNADQTFTVTPQTQPLFETDFFALMAQHLDPKTFAPLTNDPLGTIHTNYATVHLRQTMQRFCNISKVTIDPTSKQPSIHFSGDVRDLGIIVNLQNNTDAQFGLYQKSIDGTQSTQIGLIESGMNALDLYTAALQSNATAKAPTTQTNQYFQLQELNVSSPITIDLKLMTGAQVIAFLRTLYRDPQALKKDTFEVNGLPTSPEYITNPNDWYLLLIQNPTPSTATERDPQQRIQAIALSNFKEPYLLTMQINQETIEIAASNNQAATSVDVFQPSIQTVLIPQSKWLKMEHIPLIILSEFLWKNPTLHAIWMLQATAYLSILTNAKLFGVKSFADAYEYFDNIGCFNMENKYTFCIDLYNTLIIGTHITDALWLIGAAIYETTVKNCSDVQQFYSGEDSDQNIIGDCSICIYTNCQIILSAKQSTVLNFSTLFTEQGFNNAFAYQATPKVIKIFGLPTSEIKKGVFAEFIKETKNIYRLTWTNLNRQILNSQSLFFNKSLSNIDISFINNASNWKGASVPNAILNLKPGLKNNFKLTYESLSTDNQHELIIAPTSPIDKNLPIFTVLFNQLPITSLYVDLYDIFKGQNFTRCHIIKNGILPEFLSNLTITDWTDGIYMIMNVNNQQTLNTNNPGSLIVTFYKSNKTILGSIVSHGLYKNNETTPGIRHPVKTSIVYSNIFKPLFNIFIPSGGILLKYSNS